MNEKNNDVLTEEALVNQVLTREEVKRLIEADRNPKERLILILAYSAGLRINEIGDLRPEDIDFKGEKIFIREETNYTGRAVELSRSILDLIKPYLEIYRPSPWLFPGPDSVSKITAMAIENIFKSALQKAGIAKNAGIEILRRSIYVHLIEEGASEKETRRLLGE